MICDCKGKGYTREYVGKDENGNIETENVPCDCQFELNEYVFEVKFKCIVKAKSLSEAEDLVCDHEFGTIEDLSINNS